MSIWCVIDDTGKIADRFNSDVAPDIPHPAYPSYQIVQGNGSEKIGWIYSNGVFEAPIHSDTSNSSNIEVITIPRPTPTISDLQAQLVSIQAQLAAMVSSS